MRHPYWQKFEFFGTFNFRFIFWLSVRSKLGLIFIFARLGMRVIPKISFEYTFIDFFVFLWCLLYLKLTILNLFWFEDDLKWMIHYLILDSDWVDHSGFRHWPFAFFGILHGDFWTRLELELLASSCKEPIAHESLHLDTKKEGKFRVKMGRIGWKMGPIGWKNG